MQTEALVVSLVRSTCRPWHPGCFQPVLYSGRKKRAAVGVVGARPSPATALALLCSSTMCATTWSLGCHAG
uniref:Uncharacterized protein n=1 Tax=Arundo donax TaxID=35708 RepID=A0A0A9DSM2_ARUDO